MAWLTFDPAMRRQFAAIARLRWQLLVNSLRTLRGALELVSRIFVGISFTVAGVGGAAGFGVAAWLLLSHGRTGLLAVLLWPVFLIWQLFPVMATAFTENIDAAVLLRFPISFRSYVLVRLAYGAFDPVTLLGSLWLLGIALGIAFARPALFFWAALVLLTFALFNMFLVQMIFAWVERWLAQRRTREIMGLVFFLFIISFQFIGPLVQRYGGRARRAPMQFIQELITVQRILPPGLSADAIAQMSRGRPGVAAGGFVLLCAYGTGILWLLNLRLHAQYRGEKLSETVGQTISRKEKQALRFGWRVPGLSGPIAAIFEKEWRYLLRSAPMLFTLIMPVVMLLIFRLGPSGSGRRTNFLLRTPNLAFPLGTLYALMMLTNLVYNNFGGDGGGVQLFFASPVRFREIVLAKNLSHMAIFFLETFLLWLAVCLMFQPPALDVTLTTLTGIPFAALVMLTAGNLLSLYAPKKVEFGAFGRQRASQITVLISFGIQIIIFGLGALALFLSRLYGTLWLATLLFLALGALALAGYIFVLKRVDRMALKRRETLISELCRA